MRLKKILAVMLAAVVMASMSACSGTDESSNEDSTSDTTTTMTTTEAPDENKSSTESVMVYYGWGGSEDEAKYTAEIFCPEGAGFSENTLENYKEDGSVMTVEIDDEVNEYSATSSTHWHRDAYNNEPTAYPIIAQLYFDGELDAETAAENSGCSQKVTSLGFKWNGYDVVLIETTYTFLDYGEQTDLFVGVEYDLDYWKTEEGTGKVQNLTTKALFGFEIYSYGFDELTQDKCAWIAGELFGVDSGIDNPFAVEEEQKETVDDVDKTALVGTWVDLTSDWEDTFIFNADGTGTLISGPEYDFTYTISGNTLTLVYAEDDTEEYTATVNGNTLVLTDKFSEEQSFDKSADVAETPAEAETEASEDANEPEINSEIIGTWKENEIGIDETFTFKADGTGEYSCLYDGGTYECTFTYEFVRDDCIEVLYSDGDANTFIISIEGNELSMAGYVYIKQ